mgnify:FL=1
MKKLQFVWSLFILFSFAVAIDVETSSVAATIKSVLSDSKHDTNSQTFVLNNIMTNYTLDSSTLSLPINSALASNLEFVGPSSIDSATSFDICDSLPSLTFKNIQFDSLETLTFSSLKLILSSSDNFLNASKTTQILFQSCCIYQQNWDSTLSFKASFRNGSTLRFADSLFFFQSDSPWNMQIGSISHVHFANSVFYYDQKNLTASCSGSYGVSEVLFISINLGGSVSFHNITVSSRKSTSDLNFNAIKGLFDIKNSESVSLSDVNFQKMDTSTESCSWLSILNSTYVSIQDVSLTDTIVRTPDGKRSVIEVHEISQTVEIRNFMVKNVNFDGDSDYTITDSILFLSKANELIITNITIDQSVLINTVVVNLGRISAFGAIDTVSLASSIINYGAFYCYIGELPDATYNQNNSFTVQNIVIRNTTIDGEFLYMDMRAENEIVDPTKSIQLSFRNIIFNNNTINDSNLFSLSNNQLNFNEFSILELFTVDFTNTTIFNNTIGFSYNGEWITEVNLIYTVGFASYLTNINMSRNSLTNASMFTVGKGVFTYVLRDSYIAQNRFVESVIARLPSSTMYISLPLSFLKVIDGTSYHTFFYRYGIVSGNNVSNNTFTDSIAAFSLFQPFRLMESNYFSNNSLTNTPFLYCQSRFHNNYPFLRDKSVESSFISKLPVTIAKVLGATFEFSVEEFDRNLPFARFTNNNFTSSQIAGAHIVEVLNFEEETAFIEIDNNNFQQITSNQSSLLNGLQVGLVVVMNNLFLQITGNKLLLDIKSQYTWSNLHIMSNVLHECEGIGFVLINSPFSNHVLIHKNTITSNRIGREFVAMLVENWQGTIDFTGNTVNNNLFYCIYSGQLTFLDIQTPRPYQGSEFTLGNNVFINNTFFKSKPFVDKIYQNHFMYLGLSNATSYFRNTTIKGLAIQWEGNLIHIATSSMLIQNCVFENVSNYDGEGVIFAVTQNLTVESSIFNNITGSVNNGYGSLLYLARDPYFNDSVDVVLRNTTFKNTTSRQGSVLIANRMLLNLTATNLTFINNHQMLGAAIDITNSHLERFVFENFSLGIDLPRRNTTFNFNFISLKKCSGHFNVSDSRMMISPSTATIFTLTDSDKLELRASNLYFGRSMAPPSASSQLEILHANTGNITFNNVTITNLTNSDVPFIHFDCDTDASTVFSANMLNVTGLRLNNTSATSNLEGLGVITIAGAHGLLDFTLENSVFNNIQSNYNGGALVNLKISGVNLNIINSSFVNAISKSGSAVFAMSGSEDDSIPGSSLYITDSIFRQCVSTESTGGAICHRTSYFGFGEFKIVNSTFDSNSAMIRGGAIYTNSSQDPSFFNTTRENNNFSNNSITLANQTNDIGGNLVDLELDLAGNLSYLVLSKQGETLTIKNASVNSFQQVELIFTLRDSFRQRYLDLDANKVLTVNINGLDYKTINCSNYSCSLRDDKMQLLGKSGESIDMKASYKSVQDKVFKIELRSCAQGEYFYQLSCIPCADGKYSLDPSKEICYDCPNNAVCENGLIVDVINGYWRGLDDTYSTDHGEVPYKANLHKCDSTVNSCLRNNKCAEGYTGPLCAQCDFEKGFVPRGKKCGECSSTAVAVIQFIAFLIVLLGYQLWFIRSMIQTNREFYDVIKRGGNYISSAGPYIRLLTTFSQIMSIVSTFNLNLQEFFRLDHSLGSPTTTIIYPTTCLLARMGLQASQVYYWELSIIVLLPIFQWTFFAVVAISVYWKQRHTHTQELKNLLLATIVGLIMLEQPGIFQSLLESLAVKKLDPKADTYYLYANPSVEADEYYYKYVDYFVIPHLIIWGPVIVFVLAFILFRYKKSFNSERMRLVLGGYINEYRLETFYWGLILMCFKLVLMTVANFLSDEEKSKVLITVLIFYLYKRALMRFNPYYEVRLLNAEKYAQYAYFGSIFFLYLFENNPYTWMKYTCLVAIIILNLFVISYIIIHIWIVSKKRVTTGFAFVANIIKNWAGRVTQGAPQKDDSSPKAADDPVASNRPSFRPKTSWEDDESPKDKDNDNKEQPESFSSESVFRSIFLGDSETIDHIQVVETTKTKPTIEMSNK